MSEDLPLKRTPPRTQLVERQFHPPREPRTVFNSFRIGFGSSIFVPSGWTPFRPLGTQSGARPERESETLSAQERLNLHSDELQPRKYGEHQTTFKCHVGHVRGELLLSFVPSPVVILENHVFSKVFKKS